MAKTLCALWWWLLALALAACDGPVTRADLGGGAPPAAVEPRLLVVTLAGKLGTQEIARVHRTLREAERRGHAYVVLRLRDAGSQGEDPDELQSLLDHVQGTPVDTVAVVQGRVTQGAAYVALCATRTYCLPGAVFGEVTKPESDLAELLAADPEAAAAARFDALRQALGTRLERRKHPLRPDAQKLATAMVDPRLQLVEATVREGGLERTRILEAAEIAALQASGGVVLQQRPLERPLLLRAEEAEALGLSSGTPASLEQLCTDELHVDRQAIGELNTNWAEHMVGWLELLEPFLLVAGFVLILFEIKTPGVGLPGLLGAAFLGLALFHGYLVGLAELTEILVFFLSLAAIGVEIFLLPGTVVFGAVGFLGLVLSLVLSRQSFVLPANAVEEDILLANLSQLTLLFVLVLVLGALLWRFLPRLPWLNRVLLAPPPPAPEPAAAGGSGLGLADAALTALVGRRGRAATVLRPAGAMDVDGERVDVVTEGEFLAAGTPLRVLYVQGNRVVVAADPEPAAGAAPAPRDGERGSTGLVFLLAVLGLALLVGEVFFVSFGVIGSLAGIALLSAVFVAFQEATSFGIAVLCSEAVLAPLVVSLALRWLPRTRFGKQLILAGPSTDGTAAAADPSLGGLLHQRGVALSPLRPAGFARIAGRKVDVVTRGEMLDAGCPVVVLEVDQNRVVVGPG